MATRVSDYRGELSGNTTQEAATQAVNKRWEVYEKALGLIGDIVTWQEKSDKSLCEELGYFSHTESVDYQSFEHTSTETSQKVDYKRDCYYTEKKAVYTPVTHTVTVEKSIKVVKRNCASKTREKEREFILNSNNYHAVKAGFSSETPRKSLSVAYNLFLFLFGSFMTVFLLLSPSFMPEYARSLSADILILRFIDGYSEAVMRAPTWICYTSLGLGAACFVCFTVVKTKFSSYILKPESRHATLNFIAAALSFGLSFAMNAWYKDIMKSNNPLFWIPVGIFCASRAVCFLLSVFSVVLAVAHIFTRYPHKQICDAVNKNVTGLTAFIESGKYDECDNLIKEITSYIIHIDVADISNIVATLNKIEEFQAEISKLSQIESKEFIDKTEEKAALKNRIEKARSSIDSIVDRYKRIPYADETGDGCSVSKISA